MCACMFHQAEAAEESPEKEADEEDEEGVPVIIYVAANSNNTGQSVLAHTPSEELKDFTGA